MSRASAWTRARDAVERGFERWGHVVYRRAWLTIGLSLAVTAGLATQIPRLEIDTSSEGFLEEGDPVRVAHEEFRRQFGRDEMILLAVEGDVFSAPFLERLRRLHADVENEVPKLEKVTSLVNARLTRGVGDELVVGEFLEDWPETDAERAAARERALATPLYRDQLISSDGRFTTVIIETDAFSSLGAEEDALAGFDAADAEGSRPIERPFLTGEENTEIVRAIRELAARYDAPEFRVYVAGNPVMIDQLMRAMLDDMGLFAALSLLAISGFLALLFRSLKAVALGLVASVLAVVATLAAMPLLGIPLTSPTQIMPSFLLAVGVGNSVHVLVIFFQARARDRDVEESIAHALGHSGLAIVMTALTTAGGLASFATAEIAPVADVGVVCPLGALVALAYSLVLLPALIAVVPLPVPSQARRSAARLRLVPLRCGRLGTSRPGATALVWGALLAVSMVGALRVGFSHNTIEWFAEDHPMRVAMEKVNERLKGSIFLEVLVDSGRENGLHDPDLLRRIDAMQRFAEQTQAPPLYVGKTVSIADVTKEIHQALNENRAEFYAIPDERTLVAQELLLFENAGSDDLEDFADPQFRIARLTMKLPMVDAIGFDALIGQLEAGFERILGDEATFTVTGMWSIMGRTIHALVYSMAATYVMAFATITPLMVLLLGSLRLGLLSMIPNVAAIVVTVGLMGWARIPLDAFTLMVGSITLGLAVDDTIHFMHNFRRAFSRRADAPAAVNATLESTGEALFFTSLVLSTGFLIYMFASMRNLFYFGMLTAIAIGVAFFANVTLAPALVTLLARSRASRVLRSEPAAGAAPPAGSEVTD